jgi:hypothetical protein
MTIISLPSYGIVLEVDVPNATGRVLHSELTTVGDDAEQAAAFGAIERIVLAHACAGIDVLSAAYLEGLETVVGALLNDVD